MNRHYLNESGKTWDRSEVRFQWDHNRRMDHPLHYQETIYFKIEHDGWIHQIYVHSNDANSKGLQIIHLVHTLQSVGQNEGPF